MPIILFPSGLRCLGIADGTYASARQKGGSLENIENLDPIVVRSGVLANPVHLKARWRSSNDMRNFFANECKPTKAKISGEIVEIYFENNRFNPQIKKRTSSKIESLHLENSRGSKDLEQLGMPNLFEYPKAVSFIQSLVVFSTGDDIVIDFFAGSGTTGHAVMAQNATDGCKRRFVLVQLDEPLDPDNKDQKAAVEYCDMLGKPRTIAELTKERLRRAGKKIREENPMFAGDFGFRVFKLDTTNIRAWDPDRENLSQTLLDSVEHLKTDRSEADILYELLLKLGLDLCVPIEQKTIAGKTVHSIGAGTLLVCLAPQISREEVEPLAHGIVEWHKALAPAGESTVVFRDGAFADDVAKTNLAAILQQHGLENVRSL